MIKAAWGPEGWTAQSRRYIQWHFGNTEWQKAAAAESEEAVPVGIDRECLPCGLFVGIAFT
jgi:hypothetical protein